MSGRKNNGVHRISEWFEWNRGEQRGMLVMIILIGLTIVWRLTTIAFHRKEFAEVGAWEIEVRNWLKEQSSSAGKSGERDNPVVTQEKTSLFPFDPNTVDDDGWTKLGFSPGQIRSIRKYLNGGGAFRVKGDVAKMYVIDEDDFARIEPFILLPEGDALVNMNEKPAWQHQERLREDVSQTWPHSDAGNKSYRKQEMIVEINAADTNQLVRLRGIGPWLARKIVEHREKLGGFYDLNQLLEIYRMTPEKLDTLKPFFTLDPSLMNIRDINTVEEEELRKFPYLAGSQAKALVAYREKHGPFRNMLDVKKCVAIDEKTYEKLVIYFVVR